jgi:hypothetical protein
VLRAAPPGSLRKKRNPVHVQKKDKDEDKDDEEEIRTRITTENAHSTSLFLPRLPSSLLVPPPFRCKLKATSTQEFP